MKECSFKPFLYTRAKEEFSKKHNTLYQTFWDRMNNQYDQLKGATADEETAVVSSRGQGNVFHVNILGGAGSGGAEINNDSMSGGQQRDPEVQSRLYNYILDQKKMK